MCVCLGAVQFLHLSLQPARPTLYAMSAFYRPFRALVTIPTGERHTVELFACFFVSVLVCFRFLLKWTHECHVHADNKAPLHNFLTRFYVHIKQSREQMQCCDICCELSEL